MFVPFPNKHLPRPFFLVIFCACLIGLGLLVRCSTPKGTATTTASPDTVATDSLVSPGDAPKPLSPREAVGSFRLPAGFRIELVASEPLIHEPTGVCWDERGRLYVSELHGYNLEGQLEIEALNRTGVLDTVVRRVQAAEKYKQAAEKGTYGTIKQMLDTNGDGVMDQVRVLADHIPPAYGLCPANGGIVVAGQAHIVFVADRDGDGKADVVDTLFSGFQGGALERGLNAPQWGPDGWIYVGRGWNGGTITGPHLKQPVQLPGSNFRIRPDGSAIEPVTGSTHTIGHALTPDGDSFFTNTWKHALYAIPIPWPYLMRNPDAAISPLEADASDYSTVFPLAPVHPWKLARSNQAGWREYYDRYGLAESAAGGYFTSCCSPLIYQDSTFPGAFSGNLIVCEPAQSLLHRSVVENAGTELKVRRAPGEEKEEFLASSDSWFRPVSVAHAPDGSLYVTDMYREIIEDYSAVPRFMQQKYGLANGVNHGRIWRVSPASAKPLARVERADLTKAELDQELDSPHYWHRQTAERLLREQFGDQAPALAKRRLHLSDLRVTTPQRELIQTLRREDTLLKTDLNAVRQLVKLSQTSTNQRVLLQLALSLGYSPSQDAVLALTQLARRHASIRWMPEAILTGVSGRTVPMLTALLSEPGRTGNLLLEPLGTVIGARGDAAELTTALTAVAACKTRLLQAAVLKGLTSTVKPLPLPLAAKQALQGLLASSDLAVQGQAIALAGKLQIADAQALTAILEKARTDAANSVLPTEGRLAAVALLSGASDSLAAPALLAAWATATPPVRSAILDAMIAKGKRIKPLLEAMHEGSVSLNAFSPSQRTQLLERADGHLRPRLEAEFAKAVQPDKEALFARYAQALDSTRDAVHGGELFKQMCSSCHRVNQAGTAVGPDLKNAYANSRQTLLRSILWPNEKITSSYELYLITTTSGEQYSGVLVSESASSVVLRQAGGNEQTLLRRDIQSLTSSPTSLMPEYGEALSPKDCADIIEWLKTSLAVK